MREIKFRGIPLFGKEFVYGSLIIDTNENGEKVYIIRRIESGKVSTFEVKEETVGQYTGLKDKNGVEIYEGDIVGHNGFVGYVKYINSGNCNVLGYALVSLINGRIFYMFCDETDNYEVIGNIHENQELLN